MDFIEFHKALFMPLVCCLAPLALGKPLTVCIENSKSFRCVLQDYRVQKQPFKTCKRYSPLPGSLSCVNIHHFPHFMQDFNIIII